MGSEESTPVKQEVMCDEGKVADAVSRVVQQEKTRKHQEALNKILKTIRSKLDGYKFGDIIGMHQFQARELDTTDIKDVNLLLFGPTGGGKTCLISMAEKMLGLKSMAAPQAGGGEGTIRLEPFLEAHSGGFKLLDSRGFFTPDKTIMSETKDILQGKIKEFDHIPRQYDDRKRGASSNSNADVLANRIHGLICVLDFDDQRFHHYKDKMNEYRQLFKIEGYSPVSVVSYKCKTPISESERQKKKEEAAFALGASIDRTFIIRNVIAKGDELDNTEEAILLQIIETALLGAEQFIKIKKLDEKWKKADENQQTRQGVAEFIKSLQEKYKLEEADVTNLFKHFEEEDIGTIAALCANWEYLKKKIPKWGIVDIISAELNKFA